MAFFLPLMLRIERFPEKQPVHTFCVQVFYFARLNSCAAFLRPFYGRADLYRLQQMST